MKAYEEKKVRTEEEEYYEGHAFYTTPQEQMERDMEVWRRRHQS